LINDFISGTVVQYYCNKSEILFRSQKRCLQNGKWDNEVPQCVGPLNITSYLNYTVNQSSGNEKAIDEKFETCFEMISSNDSYHSWKISLNRQIRIKRIRIKFLHQNYSINYDNYTLWIKSRNNIKIEATKTNESQIIEDKNYTFVHNFNENISDVYTGINSESLKFDLCEVEIFSSSDKNKLKVPTPISSLDEGVKNEILKASISASVIAGITTTLIVLILFIFIMFLKRKFFTSRSIPGHNNKTTMSSEDQFSQIQMMYNTENISRLSEISDTYATPVYDNNEEIETSTSLSVGVGSKRKTPITQTQ